MVARSASGSVRSPSAVEPLRSQKSTVTTLRTSRGASAGASAAPQFPQKRKPSGFSLPQAAQITRRMYSRLTSEARRLLGAAGRIAGAVRVGSRPGERAPGNDQVLVANWPVLEPALEDL